APGATRPGGRPAAPGGPPGPAHTGAPLDGVLLPPPCAPAARVRELRRGSRAGEARVPSSAATRPARKDRGSPRAGPTGRPGGDDSTLAAREGAHGFRCAGLTTRGRPSAVGAPLRRYDPGPRR